MIDDTAQLDLGSLFVGSLWLIGIGIIALALVLAITAWALYRAGERKLSAALVTALAILSAGALLIYGIGGEARAEAVALGSLAIGALAATLGQLARSDDTPRPPASADD